jgi:hypothetical protein
MWDIIARFAAVTRKTLLDWTTRPEWAQAMAEAVEQPLARIARDPVFADLDSAILASDAALTAAGLPAEPGQRVPSALLMAVPAPVRGELRTTLVLAALDLTAPAGLTELAQGIRREERREDQDPDYTPERALLERCERVATLKQWRAVEAREVDQTLTGAERNALFHARRRLLAAFLDRARRAIP